MVGGHGWPIHLMAGTSGVSRSEAYSCKKPRCIQAHEFIFFADTKIIALSELRSRYSCTQFYLAIFHLSFHLIFEAKTNILLVIAVAGVSFGDLC